MGAKIKTLKIPTKPKPPKKSHGGFVNLKNVQKALNHITRKVPKKYSPNFLIRKNPGIKTFELKKILSIIPALEICITPLGTNINNYSFLNNIHIHHSLTKCQEINVENLCINIGALRVEMDIDGTGNIVSALNRG